MSSRTVGPGEAAPAALARSLALPLVLLWSVALGLYLMLAKIGQGADLIRGAQDLPHRHFFFSMALGFLAATNLLILLRAAERAPDVSRTRRIVVSLLLALVGPLLVVLATLRVASGFATLLLLSVLFGALAIGAYQQLWAAGQRVSAAGTCVFYLVAYCLAALLILLWPRFWGGCLGPLAVLVVFGGLIIWLGWATIQLAGAVLGPAGRSRVAALLVLIALAALLVVAANTGRFGVRPVRTVVAAGPRPEMAEHARGWLEARRAAIEGGAGYPVLLVTSDGGGLRAAYWTVAVLGALADEHPGFVERTYLLSGVSGGSVGAAVFAALAADSFTGGLRGGFRETGQAALSGDYLAVPLTRMLTRDPLESVFCYGWGWGRFCSEPAEDRAIALEMSLEEAWRLATDTNRLAEPFESLWSGRSRRRLPALVLNATESRSAKPRVISNLAGWKPWPEADLLARAARGRGVRLSTAAVLSARFPWISPDGEIDLVAGSERIVDGGYFDNSGAASATVVLGALLDAAGELGLRDRLRPIGLILTNDPGRVAANGELQRRLCGAPAAAEEERSGLIDLLVTPMATVDAARAAAAEAWRAGLREELEAAGGQAFELPLSRCEGDPEIPLGWSLSRPVQEMISGQVDRFRRAEVAWQELGEILRPVEGGGAASSGPVR